jgi:hypothetical protein
MQTTIRQRTVRLTRTAGGLALVIRQQEGSGSLQVDAYFVTERPATLPDRTFTLSKHDGTVYQTLLRGAVGATCTCPGHRFYGRRTACKHVASLRKLIGLGKLPVA